MPRLIKGGNSLLKSIIEDIVIPFLLGFSIIFLIFWVRNLFSDYEEIDQVRVPTFMDKSGQLYLVRHGIQQKESDIFRVKADKLQFSIQAKASDHFKTIYVPKGNANKDPPEDPGTIWPWPRIEAEAPATPLVWVVTPTYRNPYQYAELTRIAQALYPARRFVRWLVVDDTRRSKNYKDHIGKLNSFLGEFNVNFTTLRSNPKPEGQRSIFSPKGVDSRRTAIEYIRKEKLRGIVYFADDDNTYDSDIFRQMQATKTVSIWPTGAITQWTISSPVVNRNGTVIDFFDAWTANRRFPVDFASVGINTDLIHKDPEVNIPWIQGYEETVFLSSLHVPKSEFLPLAANATQVLTWHTKTVKLRRTLKGIGAGSLQTNWPPTIQKLLKKYDFLFDYSKDEPEAEATQGPYGRKKRTKKTTKRDNRPGIDYQEYAVKAV